MKVLLRFLVGLLFLGTLGVYAPVFAQVRDKRPMRKPARTIAIQDATIYVSPDKPPLQNATLVARDGRIVAAGTDISVPAGAQVLPCRGCTVTAGFWNAHMHFTEPKWADAVSQPRAKLNAQLADMLTSRGFTTVVDLGSDLRVTGALRQRIQNGDLEGPRIYTAGTPLYPENGIPYYVRNSVPAEILKLLNQPSTPAEAVREVESNISRGTDVLKLFTGSYIARGKIKPMREDIARAAVEVAHRRGQIAFAHPSNLDGVKVALDSGVDVLAHAPDTTDGITDAFIADMARKATMIPTLKMFGATVVKDPAYLDPIYSIVRRFHQDGGNLMFGTDVGYMTDYSTADEFAALEKCGLTSMDILRMLTLAPAAKLDVSDQKGTLEPGKLADFVVLGSDPAKGVQAFSDVLVTVRSGKVIWRGASK
jgi:imidazolonepropionase-like amidohydrolase